MPSGRPGQLCVTVTGLKHAFEDLDPSGTCCGISLPGYDGDEDHPLEKPFIVASLRREMQSTSTVRQAEAGWQPTTLGFNVQEEDVWMRLELHDAALAPEPPAGCKDGNKPDKVQRSGLSGGLRGALRSLSSATLKRPFGGGKAGRAETAVCLDRELSAAQCMPAGEVLQQQPQKSGGSFSRGMRRAFSSFTGGSRKGKTPLSPIKTVATKVLSPQKVKASPGTRAAAAVQAVTLEAGNPAANCADGPPAPVATLIGRVDVRTSSMVQDWVMQHELVLTDRHKRRVAAVQVATIFVPLAREGWLQKLVASPGHPFGQWRVLWVELLEDGKLSWFDSSRKRKADFRGVLALDNALEMGVCKRYEGQPSAGAYMELTVRQRAGGGRPETHIFKANHPDDASNWLADFQDLWRQQQGGGAALVSHPVPISPEAEAPRPAKQKKEKKRKEDPLLAELAASRSSATLSQRSSVTPLQQRPPSRQLLDSGTASGRHAGWGKENVVKHTSGGGNAAAGMPIPKSGKPPLGTPAKRLAPVPGTPAGKRLASASCKAGLPQLFAAGGGTVGGGGGIGLWGLAAAAKAEEPSAAARAAAELLAQRPAPRVFTRSTADR